MRVRFAPSPTGYVHVGNVRTALFNYLLARQRGGLFLLRIEDTDVERSRKSYEEGLIEDMKWLGVKWEEGPDIGGPVGPYRQSERSGLYREYVDLLLEKKMAYHCFCTPETLEREREEALAKGETPRYSGRCRNLTPEEVQERLDRGEESAVRFKMPDDKDFHYPDLVRGDLLFDLSLFGDFVILRSNGQPAYNYAVVIDDHLMGVTDVIRGEDHISNTPKQIKLYEAFGWTPPRFGHLALVLGQDGSPLSKRHGATSLNQFRALGYLPEALVNYLALLGWAPPEGEEILSWEELICLFDISKVSKSGATFDYQKLNWINRKHLSQLPSEQVLSLALPFLEEAEYIEKGRKLSQDEQKWLVQAVEIVKTNLVTLADLPKELELFFQYRPDEALLPELREEAVLPLWNFLEEKFPGNSAIRAQEFVAFLQEAKGKGIKGKALFHPLRVILTGCGSGVELDKLINLLGAPEAFNLGLKKRPLLLKERIQEAKGRVGR